MGVTTTHPDKAYRGRNVDHHFICLLNSLQKLITTLPHKNRTHKKNRLEFFLYKKTSLAINGIILYTLLYHHWVLLPHSYGSKKKSPGANRRFSIVGRIIHRLLRFLWLLCTPGNVWRLDYKKYEVYICKIVLLMTTSGMMCIALISLLRIKVYVNRKLKLSQVILTFSFLLLLCQD